MTLKLSKELEKELCESYSILSVDDMKSKFNISTSVIYRILKKNNIQLKNKISKDTELQICKDYQDLNISMGEIAEKYKCCTSSIDNIRNKYNIPNRMLRLNKNAELQICNEYSRNSLELAKKYNVNQKTILKVISENNISTKEYDVNENFFDKLDNKESVYFAALISADGHLSKSNHCISLDLKSTDINILEKFKSALQSNHPIREFSRFDTRTNKTYSQCSLSINRRKLYEDLVKHGISNAKSLDLRIPVDSIPLQLVHYYFRGWSDGDAGWSIDKNNNLVYNLISSSYNYLLDLKTILEKECDLSDIKITDCRPKMNCFKLKYGGNVQTRKIFNYLYQGDLEPKLDRKYNYVKTHFDNLDKGLRTRNPDDLPISQYNNENSLHLLENKFIPKKQISSDQPKPQSIKDFLKQKAELRKLQNETPIN
jgi:Mor family transcriptional regulator